MVVPGAKVTITNSATNLTTVITTTDAGDYLAPKLPVGTYTVRIGKPGFKPYVQSSLTLNAATTAHVDVSLQVGAAGAALRRPTATPPRSPETSPDPQAGSADVFLSLESA